LKEKGRGFEGRTAGRMRIEGETLVSPHWKKGLPTFIN
jgi:hypothetical protein